jgi:hypothetical protein
MTVVFRGSSLLRKTTRLGNNETTKTCFDTMTGTFVRVLMPKDKSLLQQIDKTLMFCYNIPTGLNTQLC